MWKLGSLAALFPEKENINGIAVAVRCREPIFYYKYAKNRLMAMSLSVPKK
jgi:hypothetical protein